MSKTTLALFALLTPLPLFAQGVPSAIVDGFGIKAESPEVLLSHGILEPVRGYRTGFAQANGGQPWRYQSHQPYMGGGAYSVQLRAGATAGMDRSEQMIFNRWDLRPGSSHPRALYFTMAFYVEAPPPVGAADPTVLTHVHQAHPLEPCFSISLHRGEIFVECRGDRADGSGLYPSVRTDLLDPTGRVGVALPLESRRWYRFMFRLSPSAGLNQGGSARVWLMDNGSGRWRQLAAMNDVPIGWSVLVDPDDRRTPAQLLAAHENFGLPAAERDDFGWRVGCHRAPGSATTTVYYDQVRYTHDDWGSITHNRSIGHRQSLLYWNFDRLYNPKEPEGPFAALAGGHGSTLVWDSGDLDNQGHSFLNHGFRWGGSFRAFDGARLHCLSFDGEDDHVVLPFYAEAEESPEFDTGNYLSLAMCLRTERSQENAGLLSMDGISTHHKARLMWVDDRTLEFSVRHADGRVSVLRAALKQPLNDSNWHHVAATFHRFDPLDQRLKLYVDGVQQTFGSGVDRPLLPAWSEVTAARAGDRYFAGALDEIRVCNYALTPDEVGQLAEVIR